jgi:hypothetical protein
VNQTLLVVVAEVPSATLFPVVHDAALPGPSEAVPDAPAAEAMVSTTAAAAVRAKNLMSPSSGEGVCLARVPPLL